MDLLVQLSRDLQKAKSAGLVYVTSSKSIYSDPPSNAITITTMQFVNPPTQDQMTKLYAYMKGSYNNILIDLRAFPDNKHPRIEIVTKDDPLTITHSDYKP
jgi:hypothetical protein